MADQQNRIDQMQQKLEILLSKQEGFAKELMELHKEIEEVKKMTFDGISTPKNALEAIDTTEETAAKGISEKPNPEPRPTTSKETTKEVITPIENTQQIPVPERSLSKEKSNWEKFVGENLISKIGIAITVLGVGIGAKYSIENNLISPLTRIILGYLLGLSLLGFGIRLKAKYGNYSAVLVSGALAILYFITFAAYSFYGLFPQLMAFGSMLLFTAFGVVAALHYNKQIIAHIGLVGAYAVPFLLSEDSGNAAVLFGYMAMINLGVLVIAFRKYWKPLYYSAFGFTWLIFVSWLGFQYESNQQFQLASLFLSIFFGLFYVTFLAYKLRVGEKFRPSDVILLLLNSFIFYTLGYHLLSEHDTGKELLGVFTLCNAIIHFLLSVVLYRKKLADRNLFYLVSGLVLVFITIAVAVQLDGKWVTLLWILQATLMFWIGRTKNTPFYEYLSYPLIILASLSLFQDWGSSYSSYYQKEAGLRSFFNPTFLTSLLFLVALGFINLKNSQNYKVHTGKAMNGVSRLMSYAIPGLFLLILYFTFYWEVDHYWQGLYFDSEVTIPDQDGSYTYPEYNYDLKDFGSLWKINYTLLFLSGLAFINIKKIKNRLLGIINLTIGLMAVLLFLTSGLYMMSELRESYLERALSEYYGIGGFNIGIRYISFIFFALFLVALKKLSKQAFMGIDFKIPFEVLMHVSILWILSSELLNWMDLAGSDQTYKLGLSILWGVYALLLVGLGIWKNKKYLRVGAIILFGVTLLKLFFYDMTSLNTISKTIAFVSLGLLLLIISFLYNKYKNTITDEGKK